MKQRIKAAGEKIKRFNSRINQYQQNRMFVNNQGRFFQRLNNEEKNHQCEITNSRETQIFWRNIWSERKELNKDAECLKDVKRELEQDEGQDNKTSGQVRIDITKEKILRVTRKKSNWKAPGPENVQGYWLKNLTPFHDKLLVYLQDYLDSGVVLDLLTRGRTRGVLQEIINLLDAYPQYKSYLQVCWQMKPMIIRKENSIARGTKGVLTKL